MAHSDIQMWIPYFLQEGTTLVIGNKELHNTALFPFRIVQYISKRNK